MDLSDTYMSSSNGLDKKKAKLKKHFKLEDCRCFSHLVKIHHYNCPLVKKPCPVHGDNSCHLSSSYPSANDEDFHPTQTIMTSSCYSPKISHCSKTHCKSNDTVVSREIQTNTAELKKAKSFFDSNHSSIKANKSTKNSKIKKLKKCFHSPCESLSHIPAFESRGGDSKGNFRKDVSFITHKTCWEEGKKAENKDSSQIFEEFYINNREKMSFNEDSLMEIIKTKGEKETFNENKYDYNMHYSNNSNISYFNPFFLYPANVVDSKTRREKNDFQTTQEKKKVDKEQMTSFNDKKYSKEKTSFPDNNSQKNKNEPEDNNEFENPELLSNESIYFTPYIFAPLGMENGSSDELTPREKNIQTSDNEFLDYEKFNNDKPYVEETKNVLDKATDTGDIVYPDYPTIRPRSSVSTGFLSKSSYLTDNDKAQKPEKVKSTQSEKQLETEKLIEPKKPVIKQAFTQTMRPQASGTSSSSRSRSSFSKGRVFWKPPDDDESQTTEKVDKEIQTEPRAKKGDGLKSKHELTKDETKLPEKKETENVQIQTSASLSDHLPDDGKVIIEKETTSLKFQDKSSQVVSEIKKEVILKAKGTSPSSASVKMIQTSISLVTKLPSACYCTEDTLLSEKDNDNLNSICSPRDTDLLKSCSSPDSNTSTEKEVNRWQQKSESYIYDDKKNDLQDEESKLPSIDNDDNNQFYCPSSCQANKMSNESNLEYNLCGAKSTDRRTQNDTSSVSDLSGLINLINKLFNNLADEVKGIRKCQCQLITKSSKTFFDREVMTNSLEGIDIKINLQDANKSMVISESTCGVNARLTGPLDDKGDEIYWVCKFCRTRYTFYNREISTNTEEKSQDESHPLESKTTVKRPEKKPPTGPSTKTELNKSSIPTHRKVQGPQSNVSNASKSTKRDPSHSNQSKSSAPTKSFKSASKPSTSYSREPLKCPNIRSKIDTTCLCDEVSSSHKSTCEPSSKTQMPKKPSNCSSTFCVTISPSQSKHLWHNILEEQKQWRSKTPRHSELLSEANQKRRYHEDKLGCNNISETGRMNSMSEECEERYIKLRSAKSDFSPANLDTPKFNRTHESQRQRKNKNGYIKKAGHICVPANFDNTLFNEDPNSQTEKIIKFEEPKKENRKKKKADEDRNDVYLDYSFGDCKKSSKHFFLESNSNSNYESLMQEFLHLSEAECGNTGCRNNNGTGKLRKIDSPEHDYSNDELSPEELSERDSCSEKSSLNGINVNNTEGEFHSNDDYQSTVEEDL